MIGWRGLEAPLADLRACKGIPEKILGTRMDTNSSIDIPRGAYHKIMGIGLAALGASFYRTTKVTARSLLGWDIRMG